MRKQSVMRFLWVFFGALLTALPLLVPQIGFLSWVGMIPLIHGAVLICKR